MENDWSNDLEHALECLRINCALFSKEHKRDYFYYKRLSKYFRIPVIILGCINSVISIGFQQYMKQQNISIVSCLLSLLCSIIVMIELYLGIEKRIEMDMNSSKDYYLLSIDIQKILLLSRDKRPLPAKEHFEKVFSEYKKLIESSTIIQKKIKDRLTQIDSKDSIQSLTSDSLSTVEEKI